MTLADGFDLCMLLIILIFALKGLFSGFTGEIFSLIGLVGGIYLGLTRSAPVGDVIQSWFPTISPSLSHIIAIAIVFFAVCIVCAIIGRLFKALLSFVALGSLDRLCGLVLGAVKGAAIVIIIVLCLTRAQSLLPGIDLSASRAVNIVRYYMPAIEEKLDQLLPRA